ncbi:MAG: hypothetical protein JO345_24720 [Streptosporangiaceae bacterium]|nr:hypothetical protein [Streptosporangiaceae bacterium]
MHSYTESLRAQKEQPTPPTTLVERKVLWAINATTGKAVWSRTISSYDGIPGDASRTSPAYWHGRAVGTRSIANSLNRPPPMDVIRFEASGSV